MKLNNETIREAVNDWCKEQASALKKYGHIKDWDTSEVTDMSKLFLDKDEFNSPIGNWDVNNVTDMHNMFKNAESFNQPIGNWNVSNVTDMHNMSQNAESFKYNELKVEDFLTENTQIKIIDDFSLKNTEDKFKLIDYKWNGGSDFNYNIFNNEPLPYGEHIGSPSSSVFTISVNDTKLYIKYFEIYDGPLSDGFYIGISETKDFKNTEWYDAFKWENSELIKCISILSHVFTNEDIWSYEEFLQDFEELASYTKKYEIFSFDKVEFNVEVDLKKLQKYDGFH